MSEHFEPVGSQYRKVDAEGFCESCHTVAAEAGEQLREARRERDELLEAIEKHRTYAGASEKWASMADRELYEAAASLSDSQAEDDFKRHELWRDPDDRTGER